MLGFASQLGALCKGGVDTRCGVPTGGSIKCGDPADPCRMLLGDWVANECDSAWEQASEGALPFNLRQGAYNCANRSVRLCFVSKLGVVQHSSALCHKSVSLGLE